MTEAALYNDVQNQTSRKGEILPNEIGVSVRIRGVYLCHSNELFLPTHTALEQYEQYRLSRGLLICQHADDLDPSFVRVRPENYSRRNKRQPRARPSIPLLVRKKLF
jgi:hypothetical protein